MACPAVEIAHKTLLYDWFRKRGWLDSQKIKSRAWPITLILWTT